MNKQTLYLVARLTKEGFTVDEITKLIRIERTLHRWAEMECNGEIQRDEKTGKPIFYNVNHRFIQHDDPRARRVIPDRESGALRRLFEVLKSHPEFVHYHQGDPRGCALYLIRKSDLRPDRSLDEQYTNGIAVC